MNLEVINTLLHIALFLEVDNERNEKLKIKNNQPFSAPAGIVQQ